MAPIERQSDLSHRYPVRNKPGNMTTEADHTRQTFLRAKSTLKVLLIEASPVDGELVFNVLRRGGFDVTGEVVASAEAFRQRVRETVPDLVLADYNMGQQHGMEALDILRREGLDVPLILVSSTLRDVTAVECIKQGATDYVLKASPDRLAESVRLALQETRIRNGIRVAHQELAKKAHELARSNAEWEQFAHVAAHDLQEPLRMVANYTQLLAEHYHGKLDDQADKFIHYAIDGAARMQTLIQDLMTYSRAGQGCGLETSDCNVAVKQALGNLQVAIDESGAIVTSDDLPMVMANASQLRQVFQNLIGNAIKFRSAEPPVVHIGKQWKGIEWAFSVTDNGISIAPENREIVFAVFRRLHTHTEYPGNGIGLAICKRIVEQVGGKIWVEPQAAPGTTFKLTWPTAVAEMSVQTYLRRNSG
jgi:signal transduction histidine kinase